MSIPTLLTGTIALSIECTVSILSDINSFWMLQVVGTPATLLTAALSTDTTIVVSAITGPAKPGPNPQAANFYYPNTPVGTVTIQLNDCISIDGEPMLVTAVLANTPTTGQYTLSVSRGISQLETDGVTAISYPFAIPAAHAIGATVSLLAYYSPWEMARVLWLLPGVSLAVQSLGLASSMFASSATGTFTVSS